MATEIPATMRAATQLSYGLAKENIVVQDMPTPTVAPNSDTVLVRVHAASANPVDYKMARGDLKMIIWRKFPHVVGFDVAGTVVNVGSKCKRIKVGDEVFGCTMDRGSMAEYVAAPEAHFAAKPKKLSFEEAAAIPLAGLTAYQALKNKLAVASGQKLLILGGSGGVGSLAIQFAKAFGAYVCTTSSNGDLVRELGADGVINYKEQNWAEELKGENYDAIFDCVGEGWAKASQVLKPKGGQFCTIVGDSNDVALSAGFLAHLGGSLIYRGVSGFLGLGPSYSFFSSEATDNVALTEIAELLEQGKVKPVIDPTPPYKLEDKDILSMFEHLQSHKVKGKLVVKVL